MPHNPEYEIRAMAQRHCRAVLRLAYDALPFQKTRDLEISGDETAILANLREDIGPWEDKNALHLVAVDKKDNVIGYVAARRLRAIDGRTSASVCAVPRLVVAPKHRDQEIAVALMVRVVEAAGRLGCGEVIASIQEDLVEWYTSIGWTVSGVGDVYSHLEQPHPGDDRLLPEPPPKQLCGEFAPFQTQHPGPVEHGYTRIARRRTGKASNLIASWTYPEEDGTPVRKLWEALNTDPQLIAQMPLITAALFVSAIEAESPIEETELRRFAQLLEERMASH